MTLVPNGFVSLTFVVDCGSDAGVAETEASNPPDTTIGTRLAGIYRRCIELVVEYGGQIANALTSCECIRFEAVCAHRREDERVWPELGILTNVN